VTTKKEKHPLAKPPSRTGLSPKETDFQSWMEDFEFGDEEEGTEAQPPAARAAAPPSKRRKG
jgi:hypothetical protein